MARRRDEDDDDDDRPRSRRRRDEDEDEEEEPRPKRKPRPVEDEDDRPRRKEKAGMSKGLLFSLIGGGVALVGVVVLLIVFLGGGSGGAKNTPTDVLVAYQKDVAAGRYEQSWDSLSSEHHRAWESPGEFVLELTDGKRGKEGYTQFIKRSGRTPDRMSVKFRAEPDPTEEITESIDGDSATVDVKSLNNDGRRWTYTFPLVCENGKWKIGGTPELHGDWMKK